LYTNPMSDFTENEAFSSPVLGMKLGAEPCSTTYESAIPNIAILLAGDYCLELAPSFIGQEVCQDSVRTLLTISSNEDGQVFELRPQAPLGSNWLAIEDPLIIPEFIQPSIYARVDAVQWESVLGLMDSVKYIGLYHLDDQGNYIPLYEETPFRISRQYGLVSCIVLPWLGIDIGRMELLGMNAPQVGLQNPTRASIFSLTTGDELHTHEVTTIMQGFSSYYLLRDSKVQVENAWFSSDSSSFYYATVADLAISYEGANAPGSPATFFQIRDTVRLDWAAFAFLDRQPGELLYREDGLAAYEVLRLTPDFFCEKPAKNLSYPLVIRNEACLGPVIDVFSGSDYIAQLSGGYYQYSTLNGIHERTLQYASLTNGFVCGTPFDFVVNERELPVVFPLASWPNPVAGNLHLSWPTEKYPTLSLELLDSFGRRLRTYTDLTPNDVLDLADLPSGVYLLHYSFNGEDWGVERVVK